MLKRLVVGPWRSLDGLALDVRAGSIDAAWDSLASLVAYGDAGSGAETVEERFEADSRLKARRGARAQGAASGAQECAVR